MLNYSPTRQKLSFLSNLGQTGTQEKHYDVQAVYNFIVRMGMHDYTKTCLLTMFISFKVTPWNRVLLEY
jgi:hypothetical protein